LLYNEGYMKIEQILKKLGIIISEEWRKNILKLEEKRNKNKELKKSLEYKTERRKKKINYLKLKIRNIYIKKLN
jgi:hypothetical protein